MAKETIVPTNFDGCKIADGCVEYLFKEFFRKAFAMKYKRVLFCLPPITQGKPRNPFTGVGYLSTFLTSEGIPNEVIDMNLGYGSSALFKKIAAFKPDLVGFFLMTHNYKNSYQLVRGVKDKFGVDVVVGGPHASMLRKQVLEQCVANFVIKQEGEYSLKELVSGNKLEDIDGLIYRKGNDIIENRERQFIANLDAIPFPTYEKFELNKYFGHSIPIISSRGCPYTCTYCPVEAAIGRHFRVRSPQNVVTEIEYWYQKGYRVFEFMDDNFTLYKDRVIQICELLRERNLRDLDLRCPNGIRADSTDKELLTIMRDTGFRVISIGVEAGNDRILRNIQKRTSIEVMERAIKEACELGFEVTLFFLIGSPGETVTDVEDSIRLALKYPINNAFFYSIVPYPATELFEYIQQNNYFVRQPEDYLSSASANESEVFFATPEFPLEERQRMLALTKKVQRGIWTKSIERRFFKNSFLGKIAAPLLATDLAQKLLLKQAVFWKFYNRYLTRRAQPVRESSRR